jgi:ABC-2 type transport system ATP-binding protein
MSKSRVVHSEADLVVEELVKRYDESDVLRNITFTLTAGSRVGLVGANGAGKSTLLRTLAGLTRCGGGTVRHGSRFFPAGETVALVPQGKPVYGALTADAALAIARDLNKGMWDDVTPRQWLSDFDIPSRRPASRLSGGEHSHVAIALALGRRVPVLIMDEPFAELDPVARVDAIASLQAILDRTGQTFVISSHLLSDIDQLCDHLLVMNKGRVVLKGSPEEIAAAHSGQRLTDVVMDAMRPVSRNGRKIA